MLYIWMITTGAFIGYLTNSIALAALFRPRTPWKLFGWTLPLTPGLIPARQDELAGSVRSVLEEEVVTPQRIQQKIDDQLKDWVEEQTNRMGRLEKWVAPFKGPLRQTLSRRLAELVKDHVAPGEIAQRHLQEVELDRLETIIRRVARREFRYIRLLGGLLGGVIGVVQALMVTAGPF